QSPIHQLYTMTQQFAVQAEPNTSQTENTETILTPNQVSSRMKILSDRPFSFASSDMDNHYEVRTGSPETTVAPSPRGCSMVNIQKLIHRSESVSSTSSTQSDNARPLGTEGLVFNESHIGDEAWRLDRYEHTTTDLSHIEVAVAPLNISNPRSRERTTAVRDEKGNFKDGVYQEEENVKYNDRNLHHHHIHAHHVPA